MSLCRGPAFLAHPLLHIGRNPWPVDKKSKHEIFRVHSLGQSSRRSTFNFLHTRISQRPNPRRSELTAQATWDCCRSTGDVK